MHWKNSIQLIHDVRRFKFDVLTRIKKNKIYICFRSYERFKPSYLVCVLLYFDEPSSLKLLLGNGPTVNISRLKCRPFLKFKRVYLLSNGHFYEAKIKKYLLGPFAMIVFDLVSPQWKFQTRTQWLAHACTSIMLLEVNIVHAVQFSKIIENCKLFKILFLKPENFKRTESTEPYGGITIVQFSSGFSSFTRGIKNF